MQFCDSLWRMGYRGIAVQYYVFDRGLWSSVSVLVEKWHHVELEKLVPPDDLRKAMLLTWVLSRACGARDFHNALRWGMFLL